MKKTLILFSLLSCLFSVRAQDLRAVFVSRLDSLLLEENFVGDFQQWAENRAINTVYVYNPYLIQDSAFESKMKHWLESLPQVEWVAIVSTVNGYQELFGQEKGPWSGFMWEREWWNDADPRLGFQAFIQGLNQCYPRYGMKHHLYMGWFDESPRVARRQWAKLDDRCDVILLHAYQPQLEVEYMSSRLQLIGEAYKMRSCRKNPKVAILYSAQKKYSGISLQGQSMDGLHATYSQNLQDSIYACPPLSGWALFTWLDHWELLP